MVLYFGSMFCLLFSLTWMYSLDILNYWLNGMEENLIIQDTSDVVWVRYLISFWVSLFFLVPYILYIVYLSSSNLLTKKENKMLLIICFFLCYMEFLIMLILFNDISFSSFFTLQMELDSYFYLIFFSFFDLNKSLLFYHVFLFLFFIYKNYYLNFIRLKKYIYIISIFLFFYWFGGETFFSDFFLLFIICIIIECVHFLQLILIHIRRIKEI